jgi:hypothetical protein
VVSNTGIPGLLTLLTIELYVSLKREVRGEYFFLVMAVNNV